MQRRWGARESLAPGALHLQRQDRPAPGAADSQIPSLVLVCRGKLGNTAEAETLWLWGPSTPACPTPVHM